MDETIDLRRYVRMLVSNWKWIVGVALVATVVAYIAGLLAPQKYAATAIVAPARSYTDVVFDSSIRTLSEIELAGRGVNTKARQESLVALVESHDIAAQVLDEIGPQLEVNERSVQKLLKKVEASTEGDLVFITATHSDPSIAGLIANTWAQQYETLINALYGDGEADTVIDEQLALAMEAYEKAQADLEAFTEDNRISTLERDIASRTRLLTTYQDARDEIQIKPIDLQFTTTNQVLAEYYADLARIEQWLADARALRAQVEASSGSSAADIGNALALISLHNLVFGEAGAVELSLQVDLSAGGAGVQPADVDALIEVLKARRVETQKSINDLTASLTAAETHEIAIDPDSWLNTRIAALDADIMAFRSELEAQNAQRQQLEGTRDLAWQTYQKLARKQAEEEIASQVHRSVVRIASHAVVPEKPASTSRLRNTVIAGGLGLVTGAFMILAVTWWREEMHEVNQAQERQGESASEVNDD